MLRFAEIVVLAFYCLVCLSSQSGRAGEAIRVETVTIATDKGTFRFQTEIADTQNLRAKGLMFRKTIPPDRAMLFDWGQPLVASMWMQNTYVSLDMLFIAGNGTVKFVAENTKPLSHEIISAGIQVVAVLEVVAGTARRIGLKPGDKVSHPIFDRQ